MNILKNYIAYFEKWKQERKLGPFLLSQRSNKKTKVCLITAIYGKYEKTCKKIANQSLPYDKICFSDSDIEVKNGWVVDTTPYHLKSPSQCDHGNYHNSLKKNIHTFNIAKYYKQNFYNIPRLKDYDIIIWMDGTIEVTNKYFIEYFVYLLQTNIIVTFDHESRNGILKQEVDASDFFRYTSTKWNDQEQPYQDIFSQYGDYRKDNYSDEFWKNKNPLKKNYGVWITCVVGFNMKLNITYDFLNLWYLQTLKYTTQDQVSFPYTCQKLNISPYSFPDNYVKTHTNHTKNELYIKHSHNK